MKSILLSALLFLVAPVYGAELVWLNLLEKNDPVWYSSDKETWFEGTFLALHLEPTCAVEESGEDKDGDAYTRFECTSDDRLVQTVSYLHSEDYDDSVVNYVTAFDPDTQPKTKAELLGLLTRVENLIAGNKPESVLNTASGMMADRKDLVLRIEAVREIIKNYEVPE